MAGDYLGYGDTGATGTYGPPDPVSFAELLARIKELEAGVAALVEMRGVDPVNTASDPEMAARVAALEARLAAMEMGGTNTASDPILAELAPYAGKVAPAMDGLTRFFRHWFTDMPDQSSNRPAG